MASSSSKQANLRRESQEVEEEFDILDFQMTTTLSRLDISIIAQVGSLRLQLIYLLP